MKIYTFNVNGIRSALNKGLEDWIKLEDPDILCFQEIKISETELVDPIFKALGYFCFWYPAQKKGYSGVAILSKIKPDNIQYGFGIQQYDMEGRVIIADYPSFCVICAYFPSGTTGETRQEIKFQFLDDIYSYIHTLEQKKKQLFLCGDVNICHNSIDIHNPKSNANTSGFLPEERAWVGKFIESGFVDCFRQTNKLPHQYSWWSYRAGARSKNLGWRIDYIFASQEISHKILNAKIHADVVMSDHCPVSLEIDL